MVIKNTTSDSERTILVAGESVSHLLPLLSQSHSKKKALPEGLMRELDMFLERNALGVETLENGSKKKHCCLQCMKAHALVVVKVMEMGESVEEEIERVFGCETGHEGYYMDEEEIYDLGETLSN